MDILKSINHVFYEKKYLTRIQFENGAIAWYSGWKDIIYLSGAIRIDNELSLEYEEIFLENKK